MVYCGKPSRGCQMCRSRRIKCDEGKPTCLQCQKSRRQCPGYKDDFDLVFRNETLATERRARKSGGTKKLNTQMNIQPRGPYQKSESVGSEPRDASRISKISTMSSNTILSIPDSPIIPIEQRAQAHFLSNFVLLPRPGTGRGSLDYVLPLISTENPAPHFSLAFGAVAMASLGNRPNAKSLLHSANEQYSRALKHVNEALRDPVAQKTDATLASVLLLSLFEVITSRRTNVSAWGSHVEGAVMLVKIRGKKQLRTKVGYSLFIAVRTQMLIHCQSASKAPDISSEWWLVDAAKDKVSNEVTRLNLLVAELRSEVNRVMTVMPRSPENISKVLGLMRRCQAMDMEYLLWVQNAPADWRYETVAWVEEDPRIDIGQTEVCPGKVDLYPDLFIASIWNTMRVSRLFLGGMIVRCSAWICAPVDYRSTPEYATSAQLGSDMVTDICASMPFSFGWGSQENDKFAGTGHHPHYACGDDSAMGTKALGGYLANWPLFACMCSDFATDTQRKWILGRMRFITEALGLDQASTFAHYRLRLPSMIVMRDRLGLSTPVLKTPNGRSPTGGLPVPTLPAFPPLPQNGSASINSGPAFHCTSTQSQILNRVAAGTPAGAVDHTPTYDSQLSEISFLPSLSVHSSQGQVQARHQVEQQDETILEKEREELTHEVREMQFRQQMELFEKEKAALLRLAAGGNSNATASMEEMIGRYMGTEEMSPGR